MMTKYRLTKRRIASKQTSSLVLESPQYRQSRLRQLDLSLSLCRLDQIQSAEITTNNFPLQREIDLLENLFNSRSNKLPPLLCRRRLRRTDPEWRNLMRHSTENSMTLQFFLRRVLLFPPRPQIACPRPATLSSNKNKSKAFNVTLTRDGRKVGPDTRPLLIINRE